MLPDALQALLILQVRDQRRVQLEKVLAQVPRERTAVEARIAVHHAGIEAARKAVTDLELRRKELESSLRDLEEQVRRYRSQQLQIKKNDEYQALTHEIELIEGKIGEAEESEIQLLYDLDRQREQSKATERERNEDIAGEQAQLRRIDEREQQVRTDLAAAQAEVENARSAVAPTLLPRYDRLANSVGLPVVVPLVSQKCGGCHLKVSSGIETEVRKGGDVVSCDNCSRMLYFET
jgi:uncharacterized protein